MTTEIELIEKFKNFTPSPNEVMVGVKKYTSVIKLSKEETNKKAFELVKNGVIVLAVGENVKWLEIGDRVYLGAGNDYSRDIIGFLDEDYNILTTIVHNLKFKFPQDFTAPDAKPDSDILLN